LNNTEHSPMCALQLCALTYTITVPLKHINIQKVFQNLKNPYKVAKLNLCFTYFAFGYNVFLCFNIASNRTFIIIPTCQIRL